MILIDVETYEELEKWLRTRKDEFYNAMYEEIKECFENNYSIAKIARAYLSNGVRVKIDLYREKWDYTLEKLLEYYEEQEQYERCTEIKQILEKLLDAS